MFNPKKADEGVTQGIWDSYTDEEKISESTTKLYEEWETSNPSSNNTSDFAIIGVIVAIIVAIVGGVIIKIKRN